MQNDKNIFKCFFTLFSVLLSLNEISPFVTLINEKSSETSAIYRSAFIRTYELTKVLMCIC